MMVNKFFLPVYNRDVLNRFAFNDKDKYYSLVFLEDCIYKLA